VFQTIVTAKVDYLRRDEIAHVAFYPLLVRPNWNDKKMTNLTGKTVLITAAAQGIGLASAHAFAKAGANVVATDINAEKLVALEGVPGISIRRLDVLDSDAILHAVGEIGRIDVLFNCAGVVHNGSIMIMSDDDLEFALELNVRAQIRMIKAVLPQMLAYGDGAIINMATVASSIKGVPNRAAYSISKAAVIGLTKSVAADYVANGIRVNAIAPGTVESPSLHERWKATGDFESAKSAFIARQPIGRIGKPEEVADLAVHLAGATYTTGQVYIIDGGWTG
jgi:2-keto-3-deoxy-L-fuconate dehydrogenase